MDLIFLHFSYRSFVDRMPSLQGKAAQRAKEGGYIEQRGVLRTNCIDCLDRTNGGQFAVAMKFLSLSLQALGVSTSENVAPNSNLLLSLMDMFGEMGDRLALQYGGSEAHKKVWLLLVYYCASIKY